MSAIIRLAFGLLGPSRSTAWGRVVLALGAILTGVGLWGTGVELGQEHYDKIATAVGAAAAAVGAWYGSRKKAVVVTVKEPAPLPTMPEQK